MCCIDEVGLSPYCSYHHNRCDFHHQILIESFLQTRHASKESGGKEVVLSLKDIVVSLRLNIPLKNDRNTCFVSSRNDYQTLLCAQHLRNKFELDVVSIHEVTVQGK